MITRYQFKMEGTGGDAQAWQTHGEVSCEWPDVFHEAMRQTFNNLTQGKAIYGQPGVRCSGPYQMNRMEVIRSDTLQFGATGEFPDGKLSEHDEGELRMGFTHDDGGNVHIDFGKPVTSIAMPPEHAVEFAKMLFRHAGAKKVEVEL